jgi:hypothetical protein
MVLISLDEEAAIRRNIVFAKVGGEDTFFFFNLTSEDWPAIN